ncbi:MAG: hypothetical protein OXD44_11795 [Gammaproteobacteria bacterium]|nr:hypothetical protein [Gammaproteobacteria bacterium]MCY4227211.1 hypothetical protein [Gammaproteobacteria bacterium]MCY4314348.1 hypothetical protein [Gammaproteobacteria bacterium]
MPKNLQAMLKTGQRGDISDNDTYNQNLQRVLLVSLRQSMMRHGLKLMRWCSPSLSKASGMISTACFQGGLTPTA